MTTRIGSAVRKTLVVAAGASVLALGGAGLASASNPSDMPQVSEGAPCRKVYDEEGWIEYQCTPYGIAAVGESLPEND